MQVHQDHCPNCSKSFYFPTEYPGDRFGVICPHCHVGYDLRRVKVDEEYLSSLIHLRRAAPFHQKLGISQAIFQYLMDIAQKFRFVGPYQPNAFIFLISKTRALFPLAIYFEDTYHLARPVNRLLFSLSLSALAALILLIAGLSPIPVAIGATIAELCFHRLTAPSKLKGSTQKRLNEEQYLLKQHHSFQQSLDQLNQTTGKYQHLLERQQSVLQQMMQNPEHYLSQIDLYRRSIRCTEDYLKLCDHAIAQYESAMRAVVIQLETSKLSDDLPANFVDPHIEFGLDQLEDQLARHIPPKL